MEQEEINENTETANESKNQKIDFYESREDLANIIHNIIEQPQAYKINHMENESVIISINGEWGSGKTTFLNEEIIAEIKNNKSIKYINFNAWEYDASNNALLSLFLEILNEIKDSKDKKSLEKIKEYLGKILKAIKINFGFSFFNAEIDFEKLFKNSENKTLSDEIREMKEELNKLIDNEEKLLIIIDELDRCKPPFAIELIEVIKHLLSSKNIIIILALNWKQLHKALENTYGLINDPKEEYLDKVVDWKFDLNDLNDKEKIIKSIAEKNDNFIKQDGSYELIKWIANQYNSKEDTIRSFQNNFKKYLFHWIQRFQKTKKPNMILFVEKMIFLALKKGKTLIKQEYFGDKINGFSFCAFEKNNLIDEKNFPNVLKTNYHVLATSEIDSQLAIYKEKNMNKDNDYKNMEKYKLCLQYGNLFTNLLEPLKNFCLLLNENYLILDKFCFLEFPMIDKNSWTKVSLNFWQSNGHPPPWHVYLSSYEERKTFKDKFSNGVVRFLSEYSFEHFVNYSKIGFAEDFIPKINLILQNK